MAIISQETWDKFTEEEKSELRKIYNEITTGYQEYYKSYVIWTQCKRCGKVLKETP